MTEGSAAPVVVAGEALIDLTPHPDGRLSPLVGGGPFNTALALGRLERPTHFVGCVSDDRFGRTVAAMLAAEGVALDERLRTSRPTSLAIAELDEHGAASYRFHLAGTSTVQLTPELAIASLPPRMGALHVGSLALALDTTSPAIDALVAAVRGRAPIMTDPNVRPAVIDDLYDYRRRLNTVIEATDILKVSDADLAILMPDAPPIDAARRLLDHGPRLVLLTLGAKGAMAFGAFGEVAAAAPAVEIADTIGAGDIFSAAWLDHWLAVGASYDDPAAIADATAFACRAAAHSCMHPGASPPTRNDLTVRGVMRDA